MCSPLFQTPAGEPGSPVSPEIAAEVPTAGVQPESTSEGSKPQGDQVHSTH